MYHGHNFIWLLILLLVCFFILFKLSFRPRDQVRAPKKVVMGLWFLAVLLLLLMLGMRGYDQRQFRMELVNTVPSEVTSLTLSRGQLKRKLANTTEISKMFTLVQSVKSVAAHHSSPEDKIDFTFDYRGNHYQYQLGRDSDRADEYWVIPVGRMAPGQEGFEIGRVQSAELGPLIERLLRGDGDQQK